MAQNESNNSLVRIAVFLDGTYFMKMSNYYKYSHKRKLHISFKGFHEFVRQRIAEREQRDFKFCQIVESHFFRGRFSLKSTTSQQLEADRFIDELLMYAGIVTHYYPMNEKSTPPEEKGIDVWLSLEAYDLAVHKRFDVLVLCAGDQDFVPLIRKVNGIGTRVMLVSMDNVNYTDAQGRPKYINVSQTLIEEASYPIMLDKEISSRTSKTDQVIDGLFQKS